MNILRDHQFDLEMMKIFDTFFGGLKWTLDESIRP